MLEVPEPLVRPGSWSTSAAYYPGVATARLHPTVAAFLRLGNARLAARYARLHPRVDRDELGRMLATIPTWFRWAGSDLLHAVDARGRRRMVVLETNSSPSGCKSTPLLDPAHERGAYERLVADVFLPLLQRRDLPSGALAVLWDKNLQEARAGAAVLADLTGEPVHLVEVPAEGGSLRLVDGVVHVRQGDGWLPVRGALRYVTQRPWAHLPAAPRTVLLNPVVACLAGGRNKSLAARAYEEFNRSVSTAGLRILAPATWADLAWEDVPRVVRRLGGRAVVKVPYANAGLGVTTITSPDELEAWRQRPPRYARWLVQALVGDPGWFRAGSDDLHHVGTLPSTTGQLFAADLRLMVGATPHGFEPVALYGRRAHTPLPPSVPVPGTSWDVLGTNLSRRDDEGWHTDTDRLIVLDEVGFDELGLGLDDLVEAYVQTVMATLAIDRVATSLVDADGRLRGRRLARLAPDPVLLAEIGGDRRER